MSRYRLHPTLAQAAGSVIVQQQALRDFHAAWASYFAALREWRRRYTRTAPDERPDPPG